MPKYVSLLRRRLLYGTSFGQRAETEPLDAPPILQNLCADSFARVLHYLDLTSISALKLIGNAALWQRTMATCRELRTETLNCGWPRFEPSILFPALKLASSGFAHLETLIVHRHYFAYNPKGPHMIALLPATLRNLTLDFCSRVPKAFLDQDYSTLFPELHTLRICTFHFLGYEETDMNRDDWALKVPNTVTYLGLQHVLEDPALYMNYLCGLSTNQSITTNGGLTYPLPRLRRLDCDMYDPSFQATTATVPLLSQFPPTLEYLRIAAKTGAVPMMLDPPSFEHYYNDFFHSSTSHTAPSSPNGESSSIASSPDSLSTATAGPRLKFASLNSWVLPDIFPMLHFRAPKLSDLGSLPSTLVSLCLSRAAFSASTGALLPPKLRYLQFSMFADDALWPPETLPFLTSLKIQSLPATATPMEFLATLPQTLVELELPNLEIASTQEMALLPPCLTVLKVKWGNMIADLSEALPRGLRRLMVVDGGCFTRGIERRGAIVPFDDIFARLPPNLVEFHLESSDPMPHTCLAQLPRSLRQLHVGTITLPETPKELRGFSGTISSWARHAWSGSDPKAGHRDADWLNVCLGLLPPGCLCSAVFQRSDQSLPKSSIASVPHMLNVGVRPRNTGTPSFYP